MTLCSRANIQEALCRHPMAKLIAGLLAIVVSQAPARVHAQQMAASDGSWVVQRAGDDELAFRIDVSREEVRFEAFKRLSYWPVLADAENVSAGSVLVIRAQTSGLGNLTLEHADWRAELVSQSETTAIFRSSDAPQIGIAHRLTAVDPELLGEWERAELTPAGPRIRRLTVEESRVVFYDRLERSEAISVSGVATSAIGTFGPRRALALFPEHQSGAIVWLYPVDSGFLALEAGDDEFQVVCRPGEAPTWLSEPLGGAQTEELSADRPTGRWMVGSGDRSRQTHILDFTSETASIRRVGSTLGDDEEELVRVAAGSSPTHWRITIGSDAPLEHRHMILINGDRGVLLRDDDNRYQTLRRIVETPVSLSGEWRIERVREGVLDHAVIVADTFRLVAQDQVLPVFASSASDAVLELTVVRGGRRGVLLRLWSTGDGTFVTDDGDRWFRPGAQN